MTLGKSGGFQKQDEDEVGRYVTGIAGEPVRAWEAGAAWGPLTADYGRPPCSQLGLG